MRPGYQDSTVTREYVYGPGYVDELICQVADSGSGPTTYYYLHDANYNVLGIVDAGGALVVGMHESLPEGLALETWPQCQAIYRKRASGEP